MLEGKEFVKSLGQDGEVSVDVTPDLKVIVEAKYHKEIDPLAIIEAKVRATPGKTDDKVFDALNTLRAFLGKGK